MSENLSDQLERIFAELVEALGGFGAAVDPIGSEFDRNFEFKAVIMGRNVSARTMVPYDSNLRKHAEFIVRTLANESMKRMFEVAARKAEEGEGDAH